MGNQSSISELQARVDADDVDERYYYGSRNELGKRHGKGIYYFNNGDYYSGNWRKGRMEGQGKYVHAARGITDIGWFYQYEYIGLELKGKLKNKIVANVIPVYYSPNASEREDVDNDERYVGKYEKGRRHGEGAYYSSNGDFYKGNWRNGRKEGKGRLVYANGEEWNGWFYKDVYVGQEPNEKLRTKIRKGMIPGPGVAASSYSEGNSGSFNRDGNVGKKLNEKLKRKMRKMRTSSDDAMLLRRNSETASDLEYDSQSNDENEENLGVCQEFYENCKKVRENAGRNRR